MEHSEIQAQLRTLCQGKNWRMLMDMLDDGYKGTYVILRIVQESETDVTAGELAKLMHVSTARIARALNTLEEKNYIRRESHEGDARKVIIRLTKQGERALDERNEVVRETVKPMLENLTEEEITTLFSLLQKLLR